MKNLCLLLLAGIFLTSYAWELTDKNSQITDIPTLYDFFPDGVTDVEKLSHEVIFPPDDSQCSFR